MQYYSTNKETKNISLEHAVVKSLADDKGLFMPNEIKKLPASFFETIEKLSFQEIAYKVAEALFGEDIEKNALREIVFETLSFDAPVVKVEEGIYSLELFHGPTLAFKDVGARFMSRMLAYFNKKQGKEKISVLVATSGDTGSAVANGFLNVEGIAVYVLYPKGLVSPIQESQFTTLGRNICAIEIEGTFDDCQALVKAAFVDKDLNEKLQLTSANSINVARFLPQSFYYFYAFAQLKKQGVRHLDQLVFAIPSGNFGNITGGLFAKRMGLPIKRFIAANNENDIFLHYLKTGKYQARKSVATIANAMDVGDPSNFARILDLYEHSHSEICKEISGTKYSDNQIENIIRDCDKTSGYLLDPHGACAYQALKESLTKNELGMFLETAHPAKFKETMERVLDQKISIPQRLQAFMKGKKQSILLPKEFEAFKAFLMREGE